MCVSSRTKERLWVRDKGRCFYCGLALTWKNKTVDHVIPKSKGGPHRMWNLVLSCYDCNYKKSDSDPTPRQLDIVLRRKILHESCVSIGQAIEFSKKQNNLHEAAKLIKLQRNIRKLIA